MSIILLLACWLAALAVVGALCLALSRAAAVADRGESRVAWATPLPERRTGAVDRRARARPWATASPGRRRDDVLHAHATGTGHALEAEGARVVEIEARRRSA